MTLSKLLKNGIALDLFEIKPICEIEKAPTESAQTPVIDFDRTKDLIVKSMNQGELGFQAPKSCDALKIIPEKEVIDFIEFKGFEKFIEYNDITDGSDRKIEAKIKSFNLEGKIRDSYLLFDQILRITRMGLSNTERKEILAVPKVYFVLVDIEIVKDPNKSFAMTLEYLSDPLAQKSKEAVKAAISRSLTGVLSSIDLSSLNITIEKPIAADQIDAYYNKKLDL